MAWQQLSIDIGTRDLETVEREVMALGALSVTFVDAGDEPILEPPPGETPLWSQVCLVALFEGTVDRDATNDSLRRAGIADARWSRLEDRVWERVWLDEFRPLQFGDAIWVCPHGQPPPVANQPVVYLDPGLAFGTGRHETTALCLDWLARNRPDGCTVVDYGCGSGILAIAAAQLGAKKIFAIDIDEQALLATRNNALANGVAGRIVTSFPSRLADGSADMLLANILAGPLLALAPELVAVLRPGGQIALSGILEEQATGVAAAYAPWIDWDQPKVRTGWVRLSGRRNERVHTMS